MCLAPFINICAMFVFAVERCFVSFPADCCRVRLLKELVMVDCVVSVSNDDESPMIPKAKESKKKQTKVVFLLSFENGIAHAQIGVVSLHAFLLRKRIGSTSLCYTCKHVLGGTIKNTSFELITISDGGIQMNINDY